jgi:hypothetical protein
MCALLVLYMIHAFSMTALLAVPPTSQLSNITINANGSQTESNTPQKNKNKPYSLFISNHSVVKEVRLNEYPNQLIWGSEIACLAPTPKVVTYNSNPFVFSLGDNAYKRYRNLQVFLI